MAGSVRAIGIDDSTSAEGLIALAQEGRLTKVVLASLLTPEVRGEYLDVCAAIEKDYTEACTATNDPCLASGCAVQGEICLQPLMAADHEYRKACGAAWTAFFAEPKHRAGGWRAPEGPAV